MDRCMPRIFVQKVGETFSAAGLILGWPPVSQNLSKNTPKPLMRFAEKLMRFAENTCAL